MNALIRASVSTGRAGGDPRARRCVRPGMMVPRMTHRMAGGCGRVAAALTFAVSAAVTAQQQPPLVERVDVSRVMIDVRVIGDEGEPVAGLEPDDFEVRIGGEPVDVESALWLGADEADALRRLGEVLEPSCGAATGACWPAAPTSTSDAHEPV